MPDTSNTLYYVHDPMCSWCWAYRPVLLQLREHLSADIRWQNVLGGLAPDSDQAMPEETRRMVQGHWQKIQSSLGTEFNFDFWTKCQPRRDTYKACRAVIAADRQQAGEAMTEAIQKAYYLRAMNPSEPETLANLASELGLDRPGFEEDMVSAQTEAELQRHFSLRRRLNVWSFPSLVLEKDAVCYAIRHDYQGFTTSLNDIQVCLDTEH
jgi:putative protein-disulfide isomerase